MVFAGLWLTGCIATATLIELSSMRHLSTVVIDLINALSPGKDPVSISSYNYVKVYLPSPLLSSPLVSLAHL